MNTYYDEHDFMEAQIHKIEVEKWEQGVRQYSDPGDGFVLDWIYCNAKQFRDSWEISLCKDCSNIRCCGHYALSACDKFYRKVYFNETNIMS